MKEKKGFGEGIYGPHSSCGILQEMMEKIQSKYGDDVLAIAVDFFIDGYHMGPHARGDKKTQDAVVVSLPIWGNKAFSESGGAVFVSAVPVPHTISPTERDEVSASFRSECTKNKQNLGDFPPSPAIPYSLLRNAVMVDIFANLETIFGAKFGVPISCTFVDGEGN